VKTKCVFCGCENECWNKYSESWHCADCGRMKNYVADAEVLDKVYNV